MADSEHVLKVKEGTAAWNRWREEEPDIIPDLGWANFNGINLDGAVFAKSALKLAFCKGCSMVGADFSEANMRGANLEGCDLRGAVFRGANLEGAHMLGADLTGADLAGANLKLANFDGAILRDADLRGAKKLRASQLLHLKNLENLKVSDEILEKVKTKSPHLFE